MSERSLSHEFDSLDEREKAAVEGALDRCRVLAGQIESILRNERRHFVDKVSLADFHASLERAADILGQQCTAAVKVSQARGRQRHR
jgi:hypothetical protein